MIADWTTENQLALKLKNWLTSCLKPYNSKIKLKQRGKKKGKKEAQFPRVFEFRSLGFVCDAQKPVTLKKSVGMLAAL